MRLLDHITFRDPHARDCLVLLDGRVVRACQVVMSGSPGYVVIQAQHPGVPGTLLTELVWGQVEIHPDWRVYMQDRPDALFFDIERHLCGEPQKELQQADPPPAPPELPPTISVELGDAVPDLTLRMTPSPAGPDRSLDRWSWRVIRRGEMLPVTQKDPHPRYPDRENSSDLVLLEKFGGDPNLVRAVVLEPERPGEPRVILEVQPGEKPRRFNRRYFDGSGQPVGTCWVLCLTHEDTTFYAFFRPDGTVVLSTDDESSECPLGMKDAMTRMSVRVGEEPITWAAVNRDFRASVELEAVA